MSQGRDPHESENFLQFIVDMMLYRDSSVCSRITCYLVIIICVCNMWSVPSEQSKHNDSTLLPPSNPHTSSSVLHKLRRHLYLVRQSHIFHLGSYWGGLPYYRNPCREVMPPLRPAINSPVCSTPLWGASGNKGSLICSSRMLQDAVTSETFNFYLPLWFPVHFLHPKKEPSSFSHARNLPLGHFCTLFTLAYRTTNLNSLKILASAKEIHIFKTTFFSSGY